MNGRAEIAERWLCSKQAAAYLGISLRTLCELRRRGSGPAFYQVLNHYEYLESDLDAWKRSRKIIRLA